MPSRRQFLTLAGLAGAAGALAGCGSTDHPLAQAGAKPRMTCPTLTPGSITSQSGTVGGWPSGFVDACGDRQGINQSPPINSQWQYPILLSDVAGIGGHYQANQTVKGERRLLIALLAGRLDATDLPFPAADSGHVIAAGWDDGAGNTYQWSATYSTFSATTCKQTDKRCVGGTVTVTAIDATQAECSYADLSFQGLSGSFSGSFVAPRAAFAGGMIPEDYSGCPTRPATMTCLNA
jgi:hypothetical protein